MIDEQEAVNKRVAELLLAEFEVAADRGDFGVVAQDVANFDKQYFLATLPDLLAKTKGHLRISMIGERDVVATFQALYPKFAEFVAADEESAVQWRNQKLKTIVVIANGPLSKQASLKDFRALGEHSLIKRLCEDQRDKAEVLWLRTLWDALKSTRAPSLSLHAIATYAAVLQKLSPVERSVRAPISIYALGLFPDSHLADEATEGRILRRLKVNAETLNMVSNATPEDWDRMAAFCRQQPAKEKSHFNMIRKRLKGINQRSTEDLRKL